jgi:hypothetical protein
MNIRKLLIYSIVLMIVFNIIGWFSSDGVPCSKTMGPGCWGGTTYNGFPLKWYQWGAGDVIYGDEWLKGTINWLNLFVDLVFWFIVGLLVSFFILKIKKK